MDDESEKIVDFLDLFVGRIPCPISIRPDSTYTSYTVRPKHYICTITTFNTRKGGYADTSCLPDEFSLRYYCIEAVIELVSRLGNPFEGQFCPIRQPIRAGYTSFLALVSNLDFFPGWPNRHNGS